MRHQQKSETLPDRLDSSGAFYFENRLQQRQPNILIAGFRFLFWLAIPVLLISFYTEIQAAIFLPESALTYSSESNLVVLYAVGAFASSISIGDLCTPIIQSRGTSKGGSASNLRRSTSDSELRSGIALLFGLLLVMLSLHNFTYYTDEEIVFLGILNSRTLSYHQINYAEVGLSADGSFLEYQVYYGVDSPETAILSGEHTDGLDIRMVDDILVRKNIEVRRTPISQEQLHAIEKTKPAEWKELAVALCGAS